MPCIYCKGPHAYEDCPVYARSFAQIRIKKSLNSPSYTGASPAPFVGRYGYPHINIGLLTPPHINDSWEYDAPHHWVAEQYSIPAIAELRSSLINSRAPAHIKSGGRLVEAAQLVAMADKPVDVDIELKKIPTFKLSMDAYSAPLGPAEQAIKTVLTSNPSIPTKVEKVVSDTDLLAQEGLLTLYNKGVDEHTLSKLLSVGTLGLGKQRKLVPTRWSITATDDILGKDIHQEILHFPPCDNHAFFGGHLGNYYLILLLSRPWSYELFEIALPGVYDPMGGVSTDHEGITGRNDYAHECAGGYYTVKLAILEWMKKNKRQGAALVFRFITSAYTMPLGVWVTREATRQALAAKPITFSSEHLLLNYAKHFSQRKYGYPLEEWIKNSKILKAKQEQLQSYFSPQ